MSALQILILTITAIVIGCIAKATLRAVFSHLLRGVQFKLRRLYSTRGLSLDSEHFKENLARISETKVLFDRLSFVTFAFMLFTRRKHPNTLRVKHNERSFVSCGNAKTDKEIERIVDSAWYYAICGIILTSAFFWMLFIPTLTVMIYWRFTVKKAQEIFISIDRNTGMDKPLRTIA